MNRIQGQLNQLNKELAYEVQTIMCKINNVCRYIDSTGSTASIL